MEGVKARYLVNLEMAASMSVAEYIRLFKSIMRLNEKGWVIDPSKSGNMLIDKGRFNLVDINKQQGNYRNNAGDVINMLIDNYHFGKYFTNDMRVKGLARAIIEKAEGAAKETGFLLNKESPTTKYSYNHAYGPAVEPWKPEEKGVVKGWDQLEV
jgi:hypothetical protein